MAIHEDDNETVLITLRRSRKGFILEYLCSCFILSLALFSFFEGRPHPPFFMHLFLGAGILGLVSTEMRRWYGYRYKIMNSKMCVVNGVFKIKKRNIYYSPLGFVPDLNIKQTGFQRLLNYGTLYLQVGSATLEFRDIDNPDETLRMLEGLIDNSKRSQNRIVMPQKSNKD